MKEVRYFFVPDADHVNELPTSEALHALRVLRLSSGDEMFLMDGVGNFYRAIVTIASTKHCFYEIQETLPQQKSWRGHIHLAIAPTKTMERVEWMVEKMTEIGFDEITFLNCQFSERKQIRPIRLEKIVIAAMKQSRKPWKPIVNPMVSYKNFIHHETTGHRYIAHCYPEIERKDLLTTLHQMTDDEDITILVGPEGDFSVDEVKLAEQAGFESISLGKNRLRTETAGLMAVAMTQMFRRSYP